MRNPRALLVLLLFCLSGGFLQVFAQQTPSSPLEITANGDVTYDESNQVAIATNGVIVHYTDGTNLTVLTAKNAKINEKTGDIFASGNVRIQQQNGTWTGDQLQFNYLSNKLSGDNFRLGKLPFYISGSELRGVGQGTNGVYQATNTYVTTDDYYQPLTRIRARQFTIVPGKYVEAHDATMFIGNIPVIYFPYYHQSLEKDPNHFDFVPGYRSTFGPFLLSSYDWLWDEHLRGAFHLDYRERRGFGEGGDVNYNFGDLGEGGFRYYYTRDHDPHTDPNTGAPLPRSRDEAYFAYNAHPLTNLTLISQVAQQSDAFITRDFFESQYHTNQQPATYVNASQFWRNWSLDAVAQTRVNPYWETVERLPDVRLSGFRQEIGDTPFYYESQSSIGYFCRLFSNTNTLFTPGTADFAGTRADTFHQITMPETFFGWLNFTPRVGGRYTYYNEANGPGATTTNENRGVFNTGAEFSFTASRLISDAHNDFFQVDGLRHIFQPFADYVYIPHIGPTPAQLPQFDYLPTNLLRLAPIEFPDNNSIDSLEGENTIRYGMRNRIQTKRDGQIDNMVDWSVVMDWNLRHRDDQDTFSDIYSDFSFKPRTWLTFNSFTRWDIENGQFNIAQHNLTLQPNNTWNWTVGHFYVRDGPILGEGENLIDSIFFYRFNENWGTRIAHYFDARTGTLQEQDYSIYRDMRSWTMALTFRALDSVTTGTDYGVAFTFSFKSFPKFKTGQDTVRSSPLVGY